MTQKTTSPVKAELIDPKEYGLEKKEAADIGKAFQAKITERDGYAESYELLLKKEKSPETTKEARELRLKLVKTRTGIASIHKTQKAYFLAAGKFVDAWKNKETLPITQMEEVLEGIENKAAIAEEARLVALQEERVALLLPYLEDAAERTNLRDMDEDVWEAFLATKTKQHEDKIAAETEAEAARVAAEEAAKKETARLAGIAKLNTSRQKELAPYWNYMSEDEQEKDYGSDEKKVFDKFVKSLEKQKDESDKAAAKKEKLNKDRAALLLPVTDYVPAEYKRTDYSNLEVEAFNEILSNAEKAKKKSDDEAKADKIAKDEELKQANIKAMEADKTAKAAEAKVVEVKKESAVAQKNKARQEELFNLGLEWNNEAQSFVFEDINFHKTDIVTYDDAKWSEVIQEATGRIAIYNESQDNKGEDETFQEFITDLTSLKTKYEFEDGLYNDAFVESCGMIDRLIIHVQKKI